jgi:hypothetical protein
MSLADQKEELEVLQSIYGDDFSYLSDANSVRFMQSCSEHAI